MKINANMSALVTNKQLLRIEGNMATSMERLSSGLKLNHAKDNPAGMAISNKMRAQIAALNRASENASDGIAAIQIADGALNEASSILQRMRELSVQAANDTNSIEERVAIQEEIDALKEEITRISTDTEYNEMPLLDGSLSARVYAEHVDRISTSDQVAAGIYKLKVTNAATKAEITSGATDVSPDNQNTIGVSGSVFINGHDVAINETDTYAEVYEKLRKGAEIGAAEFSMDGSEMVFTSDTYGVDGSVQLGFSDLTIADALGFDAGAVSYNAENEQWETEAVSGKDAALDLERDTADSAFSQTATYEMKGNRVIITDKSGFEMSFLLEEKYDATTDSTGEIALEVTNIGTMTLHIGANENQNMMISVPEVSTDSLYIDEINVVKMGGAGAAMTRLDEAIAMCSKTRSKLGAYQNRLEYSVASLDTFEENMTDAQSRLADTDMAREMTTYTQQNVLNQAAISVLSQANDMPQQVLQLLQ